MPVKQSVYIAYGFAEGPRIARRLKDALSTAGFQIINDCSKADAVVAHSMGCFELPEQLQAKTVLLVGPSTGFVGSPTRAQAQKVRADLGRHRETRQVRAWFLKSLWNSVYLTRFVHRLPQIFRDAHRLRQTLPSVRAKNTAVVLYRNDPWSWQMPKDLTDKHPAYIFISHTGVHDDLWANPQEYVAVLQYLHEA